MTPTRAIPDPVDAQVGAAVRQLRSKIGQSQQALAKAIGVSFQQVQKYENGGNRISASMLVKIAAAQGMPPAHYFEGLATAGADDLPPEVRDAMAWLATSEAYSLAADLVRMDPKTRRAFALFAAELVRP